MLTQGHWQGPGARRSPSPRPRRPRRVPAEGPLLHQRGAALTAPQPPPRYGGRRWAHGRFDVRRVDVIKPDVFSERQGGAGWATAAGPAPPAAPRSHPADTSLSALLVLVRKHLPSNMCETGGRSGCETEAEAPPRRAGRWRSVTPDAPSRGVSGSAPSSATSSRPRRGTRPSAVRSHSCPVRHCHPDADGTTEIVSVCHLPPLLDCQPRDGGGCWDCSVPGAHAWHSDTRQALTPNCSSLRPAATVLNTPATRRLRPSRAGAAAAPGPPLARDRHSVC